MRIGSHQVLRTPTSYGNIAAKLLERRNIPVEDHFFLSVNVADYVSRLPPEHHDYQQVETLLGRLKTELLPPETARWTIKISRDMDAGYTDQEVLERARNLEDDLESFCGQYPGAVFVVGGVAEEQEGKPAARFGGASDLDIVGTGYLSSSGRAVLEEMDWKISDIHPGSAQTAESPGVVHGLLYENEEETEKALGWFGRHLSTPDPGLPIRDLIIQGAVNRGRLSIFPRFTEEEDPGLLPRRLLAE